MWLLLTTGRGGSSQVDLDTRQLPEEGRRPGVRPDLQPAARSDAGTPHARALLRLTGAEQAEGFPLDRGAEPGFARKVGAEVCGHLTVGALKDVSSQGGFVSAGAFADVAGPGLDRMPAAYVAAVLERHPRLEFKRTLRRIWVEQAKAAPGGRQQWLSRWAGFRLLVLIAPFDE